MDYNNLGAYIPSSACIQQPRSTFVIVVACIRPESVRDSILLVSFTYGVSGLPHIASTESARIRHN